LSRKNAEGSETSKERVVDSRYDPIAWLGAKLRRRGKAEQG